LKIVGRVTKLGGLILFSALGVAVAAATAKGGAQTISPELFSGLHWRCVGPFDGGPVASVIGVAGQSGVYVVTTPSGSIWKTIDAGDTWTSIDTAPAPGPDPHRWVDPANPKRIVRTDDRGIAVSLDAGTTWTTSHRLPIADVAHLQPRQHPLEAVTRKTVAGEAVTVSIADHSRAGLVFAGTKDAVFVSFDAGAHWDPLRLTMPAVRINDLDIRGDNLVAATQGRSVWQLDDITPLRQISAAMTSAPAVLFKPAAATLLRTPPPDGTPAGATIDYYLSTGQSGTVTIEIADAAKHVVHRATSAAPGAGDPWLPVMKPLATEAGQHRVTWNLHVDPPPAQKHKYAHLAPAMFENIPSDPNGPWVLPGTYTITLSSGGRSFTQPLVVRAAPGAAATPAAIQAQRQAYDFAMRMSDAMAVAHRGFLQLATLRAKVTPLLSASDPDLVALVTPFDTALKDLDGSAAILVIPDDESGEVGDADEDAKEGKHPDFVPPKPVSLSKDYDDPTSILGRRFNNVNPPAFATSSVTIGDLLSKSVASTSAPDPLAIAAYQEACGKLSSVLDAWASINAQDVPRMNVELEARHLPALPIATDLPGLSCGARAP
jgi:hypothetical protein